MRDLASLKIYLRNVNCEAISGIFNVSRTSKLLGNGNWVAAERLPLIRIMTDVVMLVIDIRAVI